MKKQNHGKEFERELTEVAEQYEKRRELTLRKVDPPTRIINKRIIMLKNPFLDFCGTWTEAAGRAVFLEAKRTEKDKLSLMNAGGITKNQLHSLRIWRAAGAATGVIWRAGAGDFFVTMPEIERQLAANVLHLKVDRLGHGLHELDFLNAMRHVFNVNAYARCANKVGPSRFATFDVVQCRG